MLTSEYSYIAQVAYLLNYIILNFGVRNGEQIQQIFIL